MPAREVEAIPRDKLSVCLKVPYKIRKEGLDKFFIPKYLIITDPATECSKIVQNNYKQAETLTNLVEQACLCRYTRPMTIIYHLGNKFPGRALKMT